MQYNKEKIIEVLENNNIAHCLFGTKLNFIVNNALNDYEQKHRYYHNINHLCDLFFLIDSFKHSTKEKEILQIVALFHDVIYDPKSNLNMTNEELSAQWFCSLTNSLNKRNKSYVKTIKNMILETQYGKQEGSTKLSKWFNELDLWPLAYYNFNELLKNEMLIFKEYQFINFLNYKDGRLKFLNFISNHEIVRKNKSNIRLLMQYVASYVPRIGIYAGSFNPFHNGHRNILEKANKLFDKVIVAVGTNPDKDNKYECIRLNVSKALPYYEVDGFCGSLSNYIKSVEGYGKVTLIRGLRNGYDFNYEINQLRFIEDMYGGHISVVFIPCDREYDYISSSAIRSIKTIDNKFSERYLK